MKKLFEDVVDFPVKRSGIIVPTIVKEPYSKQDNGSLTNYKFDDVEWFDVLETGDMIFVVLPSGGKSLQTIDKIEKNKFILKNAQGITLIVPKNSDMIQPVPHNLLESVDDRIFFHVTLKKNLRTIKHKGLIPQSGERSSQLNDIFGIYLFRTKDDLEDAVTNWLGDEFLDNEELAILQISLPLSIGYVKGADYEIIVQQPIPPKYIKLLEII